LVFNCLSFFFPSFPAPHLLTKLQFQWPNWRTKKSKIEKLLTSRLYNKILNYQNYLRERESIALALTKIGKNTYTNGQLKVERKREHCLTKIGKNIYTNGQPKVTFFYPIFWFDI
jgi:hypothetical protein